MEAGKRGLDTLPARQSCPGPGPVLRGPERPDLNLAPLHPGWVALDQVLALSLCLSVLICQMGFSSALCTV